MSRRYLAALSAIALLPIAAEAQTFGTTTHTLLRGAVAGDMPGWYGGSLLGAFPVPMSELEARAAVLGAPDNTFLSLPGVGGTPSGAPFPGAYVEVGFGFNFGPNTTLNIWELGNNGEAPISSFGPTPAATSSSRTPAGPMTSSPSI